MRRLLMNLFGLPHGVLGSISGRIMAAANREIHEWTIACWRHLRYSLNEAYSSSGNLYMFYRNESNNPCSDTIGRHALKWI